MCDRDRERESVCLKVTAGLRYKAEVPLMRSEEAVGFTGCPTALASQLAG